MRCRWRRCVIHFGGVSLSCTSPHSPSFLRHDEEILGHDGNMSSPRIGRPVLAVRELLSSGRCLRAWCRCLQYESFTCRSARRPLRPAGVVEKGGFAAAAFGRRDTRLGISRHRCKEFRHDEIFEIGTPTSSAALGHCQSLVVVVIVLLRLLLPMQGW